MNKLILAEFTRLFKSNVFKLCMLFSIGLGMFVIFMRWSDVKMNPDIYAELSVSYSNADGLLFVGGLYLLFAIAVFISIFVGTEYSDGTIRNKILVGHTRYSIYFSKLIVCAVANIIIHLLYILVALILGYIFLGGTTFSVTKILLLTAASCSVVLAMTALLLLFSMSVQSKATGAVVCLLTVLIMMFAALTIYEKLSAPEYYDDVTYSDGDTNEIIKVEKKKNPQYLTNEQRKVYEFLNNFIPFSQLYQIATQTSTDNLGIIAIYDFILIIATTGAGVVIFKRKNLR